MLLPWRSGNLNGGISNVSLQAPAAYTMLKKIWCFCDPLNFRCDLSYKCKLLYDIRLQAVYSCTFAPPALSGSNDTTWKKLNKWECCLCVCTGAIMKTMQGGLWHLLSWYNEQLLKMSQNVFHYCHFSFSKCRKSSLPDRPVCPVSQWSHLMQLLHH